MHVASLVDEGLGNSACVVCLGDGGALVVDPERDPRPYRAELERLGLLPDDLPVHPTHGGGSFCSAAPGGQRTTTIGQERASNPLLAGDPDEDTFVGHVAGSVSIPWRAQFATWLGWLVRRDQPVVFVADDTVDRTDLVWAAYTIAHDRLAGELADGVAAWQADGRPLSSTRLVGPEDTDGRQVVDIRQRNEFAAGHAPGATHVELGSLTEHPEAVPDDPVLVHCGHSERAMSAASLLERAGHRDVVVLVGGPGDLGELEVEA